MTELIPSIEVSYKNDMWWALPPELSAELYQRYSNGEDVVYTWDWGSTRVGSWKNEGEQTSISRYIIDFAKMTQTNIDSHSTRTVRIVWVKPP